MASRVALLAALLGALMGALMGPASAHEVYLGSGNAHFKPKTDEQPARLEVSLCLDAEDVEAALRRFHRRPGLRLDDLPKQERNTLLAAYLGARFGVKDAKGEACKLSWVGSEVENLHALWCYFTVALPRGLAGCEVRCEALLPLFPKQMTTMLFHRPGRRALSHRFTRVTRTVVVR